MLNKKTILDLLVMYERNFYVWMTMVMFIKFFMAYFNCYQTLVTINNYGEAKIEFVIVLASIGIIIFNNIRKLKWNKKN